MKKERIKGDPLSYKLYLDETPKEESAEKRKRVELVTKAQVKKFMNEVFCSSEPNNQAIYDKKTVSTEDIYEIINDYTTVFREKSRHSFANDLADSICTYLPKYQESLRNLKIDGYEIIGYARKSPTGENVTSKTRLLKSMVSNLKERSLATKIFVSPCSWASSPLVSRDLQDISQVIMDDLSVDGNTQDLLAYIHSVDHNICLVTIDFGGITRRSEDIIDLVEANPSLKKIAVDTFAQSNDVFIFDTEKLIEDNALLQKFDNSRNYCSFGSFRLSDLAEPPPPFRQAETMVYRQSETGGNI
ncbi:hypothetical protein INT45_011237 [Circinella minor]|uniref:Uncharacterized protein n=1 Tax=Circinella minor TaxID=1195481 RepID=A0A8H7VDD7_9FUNG|nr:hypothetical protein INT45_011237 [Circinella minor]